VPAARTAAGRTLPKPTANATLSKAARTRRRPATTRGQLATIERTLCMQNVGEAAFGQLIGIGGV
jgi:hypothetical protein